MMIRSSLLAAAISLAALPAAAASLADTWSSLWVFGDSLSDNGNVADVLTGFPPEPYFDGRFSNGPVWNERFLDDFAPGRSGNFAFGGARTGADADGIPDVTTQALGFAALGPLDLGDSPLAAVFAGANDMFGGVAAAAADPGNAGAHLFAAASAAVTNIASAVQTIAATGIVDFALFTLPDLGTTPRLNDLGPLASALGAAASTLFNTAFTGLVAGLEAQGLRVHVVDVGALFADAVANPDEYGLTNLTDACLPVDPFDILGGAPVPAACANPDEYLFWDQLHPTATGHDAIAAAFADAVTPVPLPAGVWLLAGGLAGLVGLRRRA